jgi:hypothetical protein
MGTTILMCAPNSRHTSGFRGVRNIFVLLFYHLDSSPLFLFTKCLKTLVKFWRQNGINIVLYLDDGLGIGSSLRDCSQNSVFVRQSLIDAGFLINEDKSIFTPVQSLEWLGIVWNSLDYSK